MGKKDKKKKEKKVSGAEKTLKKTEKKEAKKQRKELAAVGEDDIESILADFVKKDAAKVAIDIEICGVPSPRCNASFTAHPSKEEIILFGGEFYNGDKCFVYNDLFVYNIARNEWRRISSPNCPAPRSSHQAVALDRADGQLWIFGGEFVSPTQSQFYHHKDLWMLNLSTWSWEQYDIRGGPSARSGHRMVGHKRKLIVFGGFYDNLKEVKYFNDLHVFDLENNQWQKIANPVFCPTPRSGFQMVVNEDYVIVYGGYCKEKTKGDNERGVVLTDMWTLNTNNYSWSKIKKQGIFPTPRSGFAMTTHKRRAILFGGVYDDEVDDDLASVFYNDMFALNLDNNRWYPFNLQQRKGKKAKDKKKKKQKKKTVFKGKGSKNKRRGAAAEDEEEEEEEQAESSSEEEAEKEASDQDEDGNFDEDELEGEEGEVNEEPKLETEGDSVESRDASAATVVVGELKEGEQDAEIEMAPIAETQTLESAQELKDQVFMPMARRSSLLAVKGNNLYLFGGVFEHKEREYTLNDMYSLDLNRPEEWQIIIPLDLSNQQWLGSDSEDGSDSESEDGAEEEAKEDEGEDAESEDEEEAAAIRARKQRKPKKKLTEVPAGASQFEDTSIPRPTPGESLAEFFNRSKDFWMMKVIEACSEEERQKGKALRKAAFDMADKRFKQVNKIGEDAIFAQ